MCLYCVLFQRNTAGIILSGLSCSYRDCQMSESNTNSKPEKIKCLRVSSFSLSKKVEQLQDLPGSTCAKCKKTLDSETV